MVSRQYLLIDKDPGTGAFTNAELDELFYKASTPGPRLRAKSGVVAIADDGGGRAPELWMLALKAQKSAEAIATRARALSSRAVQ